jgi:hypothetical protein
LLNFAQYRTKWAALLFCQLPAAVPFTAVSFKALVGTDGQVDSPTAQFHYEPYPREGYATRVDGSAHTPPFRLSVQTPRARLARKTGFGFPLTTKGDFRPRMLLASTFKLWNRRYTDIKLRVLAPEIEPYQAA